MKKLFAILFSLPLSLSAQVNLDSLWSIWNNPENQDTIRLIALDNFCWEGYMFSSPDSCTYFAEIQSNFAKVNGHEAQRATALSTIAVSLYLQGIYGKAIEYHTESLLIKEKLHDRIRTSKFME